MTPEEIVMKLIGPIEPVGDVRDETRLNNLQILCSLVNGIIKQIDDVAYYHRNSLVNSTKEIGQLANSFLVELSEELRKENDEWKPS